MKFTKYVAIIRIGEECIIHNSNKRKDMEEWIDISTKQPNKVDTLEIYENNGRSYTMTYQTCNRKIGF